MNTQELTVRFGYATALPWVRRVGRLTGKGWKDFTQSERDNVKAMLKSSIASLASLIGGCGEAGGLKSASLPGPAWNVSLPPPAWIASLPEGS